MRFPVMMSGIGRKKANRMIYFILLSFMAVSTTVAVIKLFWGGNTCKTEGLTISVNKTIFEPGDTLRISIGVAADHINAQIADAYLAVQDPADHVKIQYHMSHWKIVDRKTSEIVSIPIKSLGPYGVFFAFCHTGLNPFDHNNLIADVAEQVFVLPGIGASSSSDGISLTCGSKPVLIAHGGGQIGGMRCTNTRDALDYNYDKGHRYFEMDFCWTSDKHLVLIHDWKKTFAELFLETTDKPTLQQFKSMKMKHHLSQMYLESLYDWLNKHKDAFVVTDVKEQNLEALAVIAETAGTLKNQFIPQIYGLWEFEPVEMLGFRTVILTLYRSNVTNAELFEFVTEHKVFAVTMPVRRAFSFNGGRSLREKGTVVYAHTINRIEALRYLQQRGIYGIYTDNMLPR